MPSPRASLFIQRIAANVHRQRVDRGLSQEQLAEAAGMAPRSVQRMERATQDVSISALIAVADALGVQPGVLLRPARMLPAQPGRPARRSTSKRTR